MDKKRREMLKKKYGVGDKVIDSVEKEEKEMEKKEKEKEKEKEEK